MKHQLTALLALLLIACGTADDGTDDTGDTTPFTLSERAPTPRYDERPMSLETYLWASGRLFHEYYCALVYRGRPSFPMGSNHDQMLAAGSENACRNLPELLTTPSSANLLLLVESGAYTYDPEQAARCIEQLRAVADPLRRSYAEACGLVFTSALGAGAACSLSEQCGGDLHCEGLSNEPCTGTCQIQTCGDTVCERGERCMQISINESRCERRNGARCGPDLSPCSAGLVCRDGFCDELQPSRPATRGEPCAGSFACEADLICVEGRCEPPTLLPEGAPCTPALDPSTRCAAPLICDSVDPQTPGRCIRAGAQGAPCTYDRHCDHLHACREGRCGALRRLDEPCDDGQPFFAYQPHCIAPPSCVSMTPGLGWRCDEPKITSSLDLCEINYYIP